MDDVVCKHGWSRRFCEPCSSAHIISQLKGPQHMGMLAIKPDQIPDAVADSMREFFHTRGDAQRAIAAALNAWPGMEYVFRQPTRYSVCYSKPALILPAAGNHPERSGYQ